MNKLVLIMLSVCMCWQANAGFLIEPYMGYGQIATSTDVPDDDDETESGAFVGARLGYSFLLFSGGIDYNSGSAGDFNRTNTAVFAGFDLPILLRFYGKYIVASDLDNSDTDLDYEHKSGYALGAGFTGLPFVVLNLEMARQTYEVEAGGSDHDVEAASYLLSVSLPLDF